MRTHSWANLQTRPNWTWHGPSGIRLWLSALLIVVMSVMVVESVAAQGVTPAGVRVSFSSDSPELTVGDVVILSLVISHPTEMVVVVPRLEREWGPFEVQDQTSVQTISVEGGVRTLAKQFRVTLFETGNFETPAFPVTIRSPDGIVELVEPAPIKLTVNSVLSGSDDQLKDLRPPADFYGSFWDRSRVLVFVALVLFGVLGASGYYLIWRSRSQKTRVVTSLDTRSPWEIAEQEFDRISDLDLPATGNLKEHYTLVADALRVCVATTILRTDESGEIADKSTTEIALTVRRSSLDSVNARAIIELLEEADLVKFANYSPSFSRAYEFAGQSRALVEALRISIQQKTPVPSSERGIATP